MANTLINFAMDSATVANPDGSFETSFSGTTQVVAGPGDSMLGEFPLAIDLATTGKAACDVSSLPINYQQFCVNIVFNVNEPVFSRQNIVHSSFLPFSIYLLEGGDPDHPEKFNLVTSIKRKNGDWSGPDSCFKKNLYIRKWYSMSFVFDSDTAALFIHDADKLVTVHAFPPIYRKQEVSPGVFIPIPDLDGIIEKRPNGKLFFGTGEDGTSFHFNGKIAAFQWYNGIDDIPGRYGYSLGLDSRIDEQRNFAEWFITRKYEEFKTILNIGERIEAIRQPLYDDPNAYIQRYKNCAIMYHPAAGGAFEMHGAIYEKYLTFNEKFLVTLGYLLCDESNTTKAGGKKSLFSKGGIYWNGTKAVLVMDYIYIEYESLGESKNWGFPVIEARAIANGCEQEFQDAMFYYKHNEIKAFEVHGAILSKFLATGGIAKWGFPFTNELEVKNDYTVIGKCSEFEGCTIYQRNGSTKAFEVHGDIRKKYLFLKGPLCDLTPPDSNNKRYLGFPTSDETNIPNCPGGKMNTFENGSILWYGDYNSIVFARPFRIIIGTINSVKHDSWIRGSANDIYISPIKVTVNGVEEYKTQRYPNTYWSNKNYVEVNFEIPLDIIPNEINKKVKFYLHIWDDDKTGPFALKNDDDLGEYEHELNAANGWGLHDGNPNPCEYNVSFGEIINLMWTINQMIDPDTLSEVEKWWGIENHEISGITHEQFVAAFMGITENELDPSNWWSMIYKGWIDTAPGGRCFGMCLEAIYSRKLRSPYCVPLNIIQTWTGALINMINTKHVYQHGAIPIIWISDAKLFKKDPLTIYYQSEAAFNCGNQPILCLNQNYDFSGSGHAVLPIKWEQINDNKWEITVLDPNYGTPLYPDSEFSNEQILTIECENSEYNAIIKKEYKFKYDLFEGKQFEGSRLYYMPYSILSHLQKIPSEELLVAFYAEVFILLDDYCHSDSIMDSEGNDLDACGERATNFLKQGYNSYLNEFFVDFGAINDGANHKRLFYRKGNSRLERSKRNFTHVIRGNGEKYGEYNYIIRSGLCEIKLKSTINLKSPDIIEVKDLATNFCRISLDSYVPTDIDKRVTLEIINKHGIGGDFSKIEVLDFPCRSKQSNGTKEKSFDVNIKQGIGGIELDIRDCKEDINVIITSKINNVDSKENYVISKTLFTDKSKGFIRLKPTSIFTEKVLTVSNISEISCIDITEKVRIGEVLKTYPVEII